MKVSLRLLLLLAAVMSLALAGCGAREPERRASFIQFLQTHVLDAAGARVPALTEDDQNNLGEYVAHYRLIQAFQTELDGAVARPLGELMRQVAVQGGSDLLARSQEVDAARKTLATASAALEQAQAKADSRHADLRQADDLRAAYDAAYAKTVTLPAQAYRNLLGSVDATLQSMLQVVNFMDDHRDEVDATGEVIKVDDPQVQATLNGLLNELNRHAEIAVQAHRRVQVTMLGH